MDLRSKIPQSNVDLEKLGLINQGLFKVEGELAKKYNETLEKVFGFKCDLESFRIDKRGLSPEVAEHLKKKYPDKLEFGENYLNIRSANRFMMIASPDQKHSPLVAPQTSYEDGLFDEVYRQARHTIEDVTSDEIMFGELENRISIFRSVEDLLQLRTIELSLDTINQTVQNYFALQKMCDNLGEEDNALNDEYISKMRKLVERVGDIRNRSISRVFPITKEVHCFYVEFFKGTHCLRNFTNGDKIRGIFISHEQEVKKTFGPEIIRMDLHEPKVFDVLHKYGFLEYNPDLITKRMTEVEDEILLSQGLDVAGMQDWERKRVVTESYNLFPEVWHELKDMRGILESTDKEFGSMMKRKNYEIKVKLADSEDEIVKHLLAEIDPTDVQRVYEFNKRKFRVEFPTLPINRQRYIAYTLLNSQGGK